MHAEHGLVGRDVEIDHLEIVGGRLGQRFARLLQQSPLLVVVITGIAALD